MLGNYTRWIDLSWGISGRCGTANDGYESDDSDDFKLFNQFVYDVLGALVDDMGRTSGNKEDASGGLDIFKNLNEEGMKPLDEGSCTMTWLAFIIRVLHVKIYTCTTNRTFNMLFPV